MSRIESVSSINTFNQCKRKYYYSYKLNLPRKDSISTLTGKAVHDALENFYNISLDDINKENYQIELKHSLMNLYNKSWSESADALLKLELDKNTIRAYYQDSIYMLQNFIDDFLDKLKEEIKTLSFTEAFNKIKPETEVFLQSEKHNVHGYLDVVMNLKEGDSYILDYKTSKSDEFSDEYKLQLAIYALMFKDRYGKLPNKVGLHFLRHGTKKFIEVTESLLLKAEKECELIKLNTESNSLIDYEKNPSPLCKWKEGECSFYELCFGIKKVNDFEEGIMAKEIIK